MLSVDSFGYRLLGKEAGCMIIQPELQSNNMMLRRVTLFLLKHL